MTSPSPRLRPGVHVVIRDADYVQVGLDPPARVIARRRPDVAEALEWLTTGWSDAGFEQTPATEALLRDLAAAGLLAAAGVSTGRSRRARGTVRLIERGLDLDTLAGLLELSGVRVSARAPVPDLYVVAAPGPLPRATLDDWLSEGAPHLVIAGTGHPGSLRLGPLVEPGVSACLRCVDAHESQLDPRRPLVLEQLAALPAPAPDRALAAFALTWAAREVLAFLSDQRPVTWSGTVDLEGPAPVVQTWERHPYCGCAWDVIPY